MTYLFIFAKPILYEYCAILSLVPTENNFTHSRPEFWEGNLGHVEDIIVGAATVPLSAIASITKKSISPFKTVR